MKNDKLTLEELKYVLEYNSKTGKFIWKNPYYRKPYLTGKSAGRIRKGYVSIDIKNHRYYAHRLAWLYMTGNWPKEEIDHINNIKHDNRWCNLREATHTQNGQNKPHRKDNKLGIKGVFFRKDIRKYCAHIQVNGEKIYLGYFSNMDDAKKTREEAESYYFNEFAEGWDKK